MTTEQGQEEMTNGSENKGASTSTSTPVEKVERRLKEATERRDLLQAAIKNRQAELDLLIAKIPNRPREKISELNDKIGKLERDRTINSIDLQEERKILWEIKRVEKVKREVEAFEMYDKLIKDKKAQIADLKETIKPVRVEVDNLYTELSVAKTAGLVGCSMEELVGTKVEVPPDKIGNVIGKKGANVKQLQEKASVSVNVTKEGGVRIMGAPGSVDAATGDLSKVIASTDETMDVPPRLVSYLTAKDITALGGLRERHPEVRLFLQRGSTSIRMRGTPGDIENAKADLLDIDLAVRELDLPSAEASRVVGKHGATIENIQATHQVAISVERKEGGSTSRVTVVGPESKIDGAVSEVESLAAEVREATLTIPVDPCVRTLLLQNSGAGIQDIRKRVISELDGGALNMSLGGNAVVLTGQTRIMPVALEIAEREVKNIESTMVIIDSDPVVIPVIIGKGGERIKKLCEGKKVNIEVDKTGKVTLCGLVKDEVTEVEQALKDLIAGHQVTRINVDASFYKSQSHDIRRYKSSFLNTLCHLKFDDDRCDIVLRGESDKIKEAESVVREYLETNFKEEVSFSGEEITLLISGGKGCKLKELSVEYDVNLYSNRDRGLVEARGKRENVQQAIKAINSFLFGGDGCSVAKVALTDELLGMVIGKGGKKKDQLQKKYENVSIVVNGSEKTITLRGPEDQVEECRAEILKLVATARVTGTITVSKEVHDKLNHAHAARDVIHGIPVQLSISDDAITVRGYSPDVKDALALLNSAIQGKYESRLALPSTQFRIVKDTCSRNSSHLDRITKMTGASAIVDSSDESIVLRGNQGQVKMAKLKLMKLLEFLLNSSFGKIDIPDSLVPSVADVPTLAKVSAVSGASVVLDRDTNSLLVFSTDSPKVVEACALLKSKINEAAKLCFVLQLEPTEDWVVSSIIGKRGSNINSLRKSTKCHIDVDSKTLKVTMMAEDLESLAKGRETLEAFVDKTRCECAVIEIPERDLPAFIGRGGVGIAEFAKTHQNCDVQLQKQQYGFVRITGEELHVTAAKTALHEWIKHREDSRKQSHSFEVMQIQKSQVRILLANKAAKIHAVQEEFRCRIDIDREKALISIRAGDDDKRQGAAAKIRAILEAGHTASDSREATTSSDENFPARSARRDGKRGGKKSAGDEGAGNRSKESPQPPVQDSDFPSLLGKKWSSVATDSAATESGNWVSIAATHQARSGSQGDDDLYMAMVADGVADDDDQPSPKKSATAAQPIW